MERLCIGGERVAGDCGTAIAALRGRGA